MALTIVVVGFLETTVPLGLRILYHGHVLFMNGMIEGDYFISVWSHADAIKSIMLQSVSKDSAKP